MRFSLRKFAGRLAATLVVLSATALTACGPREPAAPEAATESAKGEKKDELRLSKEEAERAGVALEQLKSQPVEDTVKVTATIRANQERTARVAPRIEGRIVAVGANLGDAVRAGQVLATLDSMAVGEAWSALSQARSASRVADADYKRAASLQAEEIISQKDYLRAKAEQEKAAATLRAAEDHLRLLGVSGNSSGATSVFPLTTPLAGTVVEKKAVVGGLAGPAEPLFVVADLSRLWIEANLAESQLARVKVGAQAKVTVAAYPNESFPGRVTYVASVLDRETRSVPARIEVDNPDGRLKLEMFATAIISNGPSEKSSGQEVLTVPDQAIVLMQGQPTVFVFEDGAYEQRAIDPGERLGNRTIVRSGVKSGEQVVSAGTYALKARVLKSQIGDTH